MWFSGVNQQNAHCHYVSVIIDIYKASGKQITYYREIIAHARIYVYHSTTCLLAMWIVIIARQLTFNRYCPCVVKLFYGCTFIGWVSATDAAYCILNSCIGNDTLAFVIVDDSSGYNGRRGMMYRCDLGTMSARNFATMLISRQFVKMLTLDHRFGGHEFEFKYFCKCPSKAWLSHCSFDIVIRHPRGFHKETKHKLYLPMAKRKHSSCPTSVAQIEHQCGKAILGQF